jgi:nucleoside-diphosphate-sugar epimerase
MVTPDKRVRRIANPGKGVGHSWVYLPDLGAAVGQLMEREDRLAAFERVQIEGVWDASGTTMVEAIRKAAGDHRIRETAFPWWLMRALAPFGGFPREVVEIEPYWRHPMRFDNRRLVELIGREPRTPLDEAVAMTLAGLGCLPSARSSRTTGVRPGGSDPMVRA